MTDVRPATGAKKRTDGRSKVANGTKLLPTVDGRSVWGRLMSDTFHAVTAHCGGVEHAGELKRLTARRIALLEAELTFLEDRFARIRAGGGEPTAADLDLYSRLSNTQRRHMDVRYRAHGTRHHDHGQGAAPRRGPAEAHSLRGRGGMMADLTLNDLVGGVLAPWFEKPPTADAVCNSPRDAAVRAVLAAINAAKPGWYGYRQRMPAWPGRLASSSWSSSAQTSSSPSS